MKMETYNAPIMGGLLMDVDRVLRFLRLQLKVLKLVLLDLPGHVPQGSLPWCLRVCYSCGRMRMVGKRQMPLSLHCKYFNIL